MKFVIPLVSHPETTAAVRGDPSGAHSPQRTFEDTAVPLVRLVAAAIEQALASIAAHRTPAAAPPENPVPQFDPFAETERDELHAAQAEPPISGAGMHAWHQLIAQAKLRSPGRYDVALLVDAPEADSAQDEVSPDSGVPRLH